MKSYSQTRKRQRLMVVLLALVATGTAVAAILGGLGGDSLNAFLKPADVQSAMQANTLTAGKRLRVGGLVATGSRSLGEDGVTHYFTVTDCVAFVPVIFRGIVPDLFAEGEGVITEGIWEKDGRLKADTVLAKHDENYAPPGMLPENTDGCQLDDSYGSSSDIGAR